MFRSSSFLALFLATALTACGDDVTSSVLSKVVASDQAPEAPHDTVVIDQVIADEAGWLLRSLPDPGWSRLEEPGFCNCRCRRRSCRAPVGATLPPGAD